MPYIITVSERGCGTPCEDEQGRSHCEDIVVSRRAVRTLDEARQAIALIIGECRIAMDPDGDHEAAWPDWDERVHSALSFPIENGLKVTLGPLPDGTVIKVEHVNWQHIRAGAGLSGDHSKLGHDALIAAYNGAQSIRSTQPEKNRYFIYLDYGDDISQSHYVREGTSEEDALRSVVAHLGPSWKRAFVQRGLCSLTYDIPYGDVHVYEPNWNLELRRV